MKAHKIAIVGCGPGATDYLTPAARASIERADVLAGAPRLLDAFSTLQAKRIPVKADIKAALDQIAGHAGQLKVAVLVTGDPGVFSLAQPVIERFGRDACDIIPGVSSVQVACARVGLGSLGAHIISAHEATPDLPPASLAGEKKIAVLAGNDTTKPWIDDLAASLADSHRCFTCENLTLSDERVREVAAVELKSMKLCSLTIVLFISREVLA
jgi:cobalt-precorrin-7 (C5)-methyltransferase